MWRRCCAPATTAFLIVTSPEPEPAREATFLADRLARGGNARGELIVNRVHTTACGGLAAPELAGAARARARRAAGRGASRGNLADFDVLARRDRETIERLSEVLGERGRGRPLVVPYLDEDVQDLLGLARIAEHLFG